MDFKQFRLWFLTTLLCQVYSMPTTATEEKVSK